MYSELLDHFAGQEVVDFNGPKDWRGPHITYRLREDYDDELKISQRIDSLLEQPGCDQLTALIIGAWSGSCEGNDSGEIVKDVVAAAPRLPGLRHLFFGEMIVEECEVSWINQSDVSPLLTAFPKLESLRIRGGSGLSFSRIRHEALKELAVETGGLSRSTIREIFLCEFPALEHLELLLGEDSYGWDGTVEDLQPLFSGRLFPNLKYLGLMNSQIANEIAAVVVNSPIIGRIETLDLSLGTLDTEGVRSLMRLAGRGNLRKLDISHNYSTQEAIDRLIQTLPFEVVTDEPEDPDDEWRSCVHAE